MADGADLAEMIERARLSPDPVARDLAEMIERAIVKPDQRVGAAFKISRRGGDRRQIVRARRDEALRSLARLLCPGQPLEQQAREIIRAADRFVSIAWRRERCVADTPDGTARALLRQIAESDDSGAPVPRLRQIKNILGSAKHSPV